jgi:hypothetical protein
MCVPSVGPNALVWSDRTGGNDPQNCAAPTEQHRYTFPSSVDGAPDGALGPLLGGNYHYLRSNLDLCVNETTFDGADSGSGDFSLSFDVDSGQCPNRGGFVGVSDTFAEGALWVHRSTFPRKTRTARRVWEKCRQNSLAHNHITVPLLQL